MIWELLIFHLILMIVFHIIYSMNNATKKRQFWGFWGSKVSTIPSYFYVQHITYLAKYCVNTVISSIGNNEIKTVYMCTCKGVLIHRQKRNRNLNYTFSWNFQFFLFCFISWILPFSFPRFLHLLLTIFTFPAMCQIAMVVK